MAESVARVKILAQIEGLEGFDKLKGAFKGLQQAIGPADADLSKARKEILEFGKAGAKTEQVIRGQVDALKALQGQASIGSTVYRQLGKDIKDLGSAYKEAATGVKQFTDAALKSQKPGAKTSTFGPQIQALKKDLAELSVYSQAYADKLTQIKRRELPFNLAQGRQGVIAAAETYRLGPDLANAATKMPQLPDTTAGLNQRLSELNAEFVNLARGGDRWIQVSREIANVQRQLNQEFANPAVEAARRRLDASRNTSSGFLAFSSGLEDRIAIEKSIARNQRKANAGALIQAPEAPMREISALYQSIGNVGMSRISGDIDRMGKSYTEVAQDIRTATAASDGSINSLRAQRNSWEALRNTLGSNKVALREVNKEITAVDRQLEKRGVGGSGIGPKVQAFGAIASGAIFGGAEGAIGGLAGAAIGGVPGAFAGAAVGGSISMIRQNVVAMGEFSAEVAKLEIALRGVAGSASEFAAAQQVIKLAQIELNVPVMEATKGFTQLTAAVKGAGGNVGDAEVVFRGVSEAIKATGGGADEVQGALTAMAQIFSKGKVSAEELQGQLGERLPGAVTLFAQATGRTLPQLQKDLEQGVVGLNDVMEFAASLSDRYSEQAIKMAASTEDSTARMKVALDDLRRAFGSIVQPITASVQSVITKLAEMAVRALRAVGLVKDSMAELGAAGRAKDLQTRTVDAYRALGSGPQSYAEKKRAFELADELADAATPQKSLTGVQQNIRALQQARQVIRQINAEGLDQKQLDLLVSYGSKLDGRIAKEQEVLAALQKQRKLTEFQTVNRDDKTGKEKANAAAKEQAATERLAAEQQRLDELLARNVIQLDDERFRHRQELIRKEFEYQQELAQRQNELWANNFVGLGAQSARAIADLFGKLDGYRKTQFDAQSGITAAQQGLRSAQALEGVTSQGLAGGAQLGKLSSQGQALVAAARTLGVSPLDLATIIGFETGGTYSPSKRGGAGNNYMGLIQFGPNERKAYGASPNQSFEQQVTGPVVRYFQDRFKGQGMSTQGADLLTLYRTVLGGNPKASLTGRDAFGTSPQSGVARMAPHRSEALRRFFGGDVANIPPMAAGVAGQVRRDVSAEGQIAVSQAQLLQQQKLAEFEKKRIDALKSFDFAEFNQQLTRGLVEQNMALGDGIADLQIKNRLEAEGMRPKLIEAEVKKNQLLRDQQRLLEPLKEAQGIAGLDLSTKERIAEAIANINGLYSEQISLIERQAQAQTASGVALGAYIGQLRQELEQLTNFENVIISVSRTMETEISGAISSAVTGLVTGSQTVRETLGQMFSNIGQAFVKMAADIMAKQLAMITLQTILKALGAVAGGAGGGGGGGLFGAGSPDAVAGGGIFTGAGPYKFADGGVMTGRGPIPLRKYARGGIANSPQMALFGEGAQAEAYVPLPDGRRIPVAMQGNNRMRDLMGSSPAQAPASPVLNMNFQSTNIGGVEYVSRDQLEAAMAETRRAASRDGAKRGMSMTLDKLQQSPSTRTRVGLR